MINILVGGLPRTLVALLEARVEGAAVHIVDTGAEALEWLAGRSCQLLVLDHALAGVSAIEVVQALTEGSNSASLPVLFCLQRGAGMERERHRAERLGIRSFLTHPIDIELLADHIRRLTGPIGGNGTHSGNGRGSSRAEAPESVSGPGWQRLRRSLGRRIDVLDEAAIAFLDGTIEVSLKGRAWREAHQLAEILAAFGRPDATRLAREAEALLERRTEPGPGETLRLSELAVSLRAELERSDSFEGTEAINDNRPLLLFINRHSEFVESVGIEAEASGLRLEIAADPETARGAIERDRPAVALIDLDAASEPEAWIAFIAEVSGGDNDIPVLVTTGAASMASRVAIARAGGFAVLRKPMSPAAAVAAAIGAIRRTDLDGRHVLAVDDDLLALAALRNQLEPSGIELTTLDDPRRFWETMEAVRPEIVLLDTHMPHYSGLELCHVLRSDERWARTTVVILGDRMDSAASHLAQVAGADDFIAKPVVGSELLTRIANRLERVRVAEERAGIEPLTGVPARHAAESSMDTLLRLAARYRLPYSVAAINVDGLRSVNESCGHAVGDAVLRRLARLLRGGFRVEDVVGRWGGEQFIVGAYGMEKDDCVRRLHELLTTFRADTFRAGEAEVRVGFSAGVSTLFTDGADLPSLIHAATDTLAQAKTVGRGRILPAGWTPERSRPTEFTEIVLVDRDAALAGLLQHAFEQNGWRTTWFQDADTATAALCGPYPLLRASVLLLDVDLPGRDGFSVLRALGRDDVLARMRVIMVTARANESEVLKAFDLGASDHVAKPFSVQVLMRRIRRAIRC